MALTVPIPRIAVMASVALLAVAAIAEAHPGTGIAVDRQGQVFFVDTGEGVFKVDAQGKLSPQEGPAFHWMTLDPSDRFGRTRLPQGSTFEMTVVGSNPSLILSSDFPVTIGRDGALYFPEVGRGERLQVVRLTSSGARSVLATLPRSTESGPLRWHTGMATGPGGAIFYTENKAVRRIDPQGRISTVAGNVRVPGCVRIPGVGPELGPYLRGLDVASDGTVYVAATGCGAVLRITPQGRVSPVLRTESPWSPTSVAVAGRDLYVLEFLHTASDNRREWIPRVRKVSRDGRVTLVAAVRR
jgi:hypothetical protein